MHHFVGARSEKIIDLFFMLYQIYKLFSNISFIILNIANFSETIIDEMMQRLYKPDVALADMQRIDCPVEIKSADVPSAEKLEKFVEDVK